MTIFFILLFVALLVWWVVNRNSGSRGSAGPAPESDVARQQRFQQDSLAAQRRYIASQNAQHSHEKTISEGDSDRYLNTPTMRSDDAGSGDDAEKKERIRRYIAAQKRYVEAENARHQNGSEMSPALPEFRPTVTVTPSVTESEAQSSDNIAWDDDYLNDYAVGATRKKLEGIELCIYFVDRNGVATERNISTLNYVHDQETHGGGVYAFCHLRKANRPFAFSRIKRAVDLRTGEVIVDLGAYLDSIYFATPAGVVDKFLDEHGAGMFVLFSFAKADGAMRAKERIIMLDWARSQGLTDEAALAHLEEQMKKVWYATDHAFWNAVKAVQKEGRDADYMQSIWQAVRDVLNSDKKLSEQEEKYLKYAARQWGFQVPELAASPQAKLKA